MLTTSLEIHLSNEPSGSISGTCLEGSIGRVLELIVDPVRDDAEDIVRVFIVMADAMSRQLGLGVRLYLEPSAAELRKDTD